jgi:hypothetical protein
MIINAWKSIRLLMFGYMTRKDRKGHAVRGAQGSCRSTDVLKETDISKCWGRKKRGFCRRRERLPVIDTGKCHMRREQNSADERRC